MELANEADNKETLRETNRPCSTMCITAAVVQTERDRGARVEFTRFTGVHEYDASTSFEFFRGPIALNILLPRKPRSIHDQESDSAIIRVTFDTPPCQRRQAGQLACIRSVRRCALADDS